MAIAKESEDSIIIAGDLVDALDKKILEKPKNKKEAFQMLKCLSGKNFRMIAGLAVYNTKTKKMLSTAKECKVKFRDLLDKEIKHYVESCDVTKHAGGFDVNGAIRFAENISGEFCLYGLPMNELVHFLREQGVDV